MRSLQRPGRSPVLAPHGMASTSNPLSTQAAVTVLQNGGNAMDAAIAASAVKQSLNRSPLELVAIAFVFIPKQAVTRSSR